MRRAISSGLCVALLVLTAATGCKKKTAPTDNAAASGSAAGSAAAGSGSGSAAGSGAGSATPVAKGPPPPGASHAGEDCGPKLAKLDVKAAPQPSSLAPGAAPPPAAKVDPASISKAGIPTMAVKGFAGVKQSGFRVSYAESQNPLHENLHQILQENKMFELAAQGLNETIRLPTTVDIQLVDCDTVNAFYDPNSHRIIVCYELLEYFLGQFKDKAANDQELGMAVLGATMFSFYHETGHGLIHLLDLPAVGREEDSVDQLATLILIAAGDDGVAMALSGAYWFQMQQASSTETPFSDEHSFDGQRFYNIMCLIYGSDPEKYAGFVANGNLPQERAERCPEEYAHIKKSWEKLLEPFLTNGAAQNIDLPPQVPADEIAATAPAGDDHTVTCQQVAEKATQLIAIEFEKQSAGLDDEQKAAAATEIQSNMPSFLEQFLTQCAKENWPDKDRKCVLAADTIDEASKCGQ
ncbi:MAG: DUF4344 domain-containing metallopeptidase [Deltaproteobacteria bacterium]|nr:DUF4344 domain-containing metallopeptidase [Deltaproteobacteria bacterium]